MMGWFSSGQTRRSAPTDEQVRLGRTRRACSAHRLRRSSFSMPITIEGEACISPTMGWFDFGQARGSAPTVGNMLDSFNSLLAENTFWPDEQDNE